MKVYTALSVLCLVSATLASAPQYCPSSVDCPVTNSTDVIQLPDPDNCGAFCKCEGGLAFFIPCPKGLLYNTQLKVCDYPQDVNCGDRPMPPSRMVVSSSKQCPAEISNQCPKDDPTTPVYFPYPGDNHRFCVCSNGAAWEQTCPGDLIFDLTKDVCVGPDSKQCSQDVSSDCPLVDPTPPKYLADPTDCHKFCECSGGKAYELKCPGDLVFDPDLNVCVHPDEYPCNTGRANIPDDIVFEGQKCDKTVSSRCPPDDTGTPVFFPFPGDCHSYCMCSHGTAYKFTCAANLVFDTTNNNCDYSPCNSHHVFSLY